MNVRAAYLGVILIWSTTPLAIKWSSEGVSFLFGALSRMTLGLLCVLVVCALRREFLRWDRAALLAYLAAAVGILPAMFSVYWGAQFIPSGWVAIVFGLSPVITAALAALLLRERTLTPGKVVAQLCGMAGLGLVLHSSFALGTSAVLGIGAVLVSTCFHALSAVLLKRLATDLPPFTLVAGGLICALPGYGLSWWWFDGSLPAHMPARALGAILYLGIVATTAGFAMYYYILRHLAPTQVALITLISPLTALILGRLLNSEPLQARTLLGALLVLLALVLHEVLPAVLRSRRVLPMAPTSPEHRPDPRSS